jgi:hypothetical protein
MSERIDVLGFQSEGRNMFLRFHVPGSTSSARGPGGRHLIFSLHTVITIQIIAYFFPLPSQTIIIITVIKFPTPTPHLLPSTS